jgi:nitroreductase
MAVLFGAPCLIVGSIPKAVRGEYAMLDMGLILQTICLAAWDRDVASCIMAASVGYPSLLRQMGGVSQDRLVAMGIALGYADKEAPLNRFSRIRMDLEEMITWVG